MDNSPKRSSSRYSPQTRWCSGIQRMPLLLTSCFVRLLGVSLAAAARTRKSSEGQGEKQLTGARYDSKRFWDCLLVSFMPSMGHASSSPAQRRQIDAGGLGQQREALFLAAAPPRSFMWTVHPACDVKVSSTCIVTAPCGRGRCLCLVCSLRGGSV